MTRLDAARFGVLGLALVNVVLLATALAQPSRTIQDGAGSVTTGGNVALSIFVTLGVALALQAARLPSLLREGAQAFALSAQAAHALGHLAGWYYSFAWYDDLLHVVLVFAAAVLALRAAQALGVFPPAFATPLRVALVALVAALAVANVWELFEFTMDEIQGTREQDDLRDTMRDMLDGALGGALAGAYAALRPLGNPPRPTPTGPASSSSRTIQISLKKER